MLTFLNPRTLCLRYFRTHRDGEMAMFDAETTALLRTIHAEVCEPLSRYEIVARTHVATRILEAAREGTISADRLRLAALSALGEVPSKAQTA
jgi:hypothetical protein